MNGLKKLKSISLTSLSSLEEGRLPWLMSCHVPGVIIIQKEKQTLIQICLRMRKDHRHLSNIDRLKVCTTCLVCLTSTVNGHHKKKKKKPWKTGTSSGHITNLKQSILDFRYLWERHSTLAVLMTTKICQIYYLAKKMLQWIELTQILMRIPQWGLPFLYLFYLKIIVKKYNFCKV
jgi:hypothetical protein